MHDYETVPVAVQGLKKYFVFYNWERQRQALDYQRPKKCMKPRKPERSRMGGERMRCGMTAKTAYRTYFFLSLALLLSGCMNNGIEWSELTFTRKKPNQAELIGTWVPTAATIKDLKDRGGYAISKHELILRADGSFSMVNMPDWWTDSFGQSKKGFESGSGKWQLYQDRDPWTVWAIELDFPKFTVPNAIHLRRQKPPYLIHITVGDPDSGHAMLFEKRLNPKEN